MSKTGFLDLIYDLKGAWNWYCEILTKELRVKHIKTPDDMQIRGNHEKNR